MLPSRLARRRDVLHSKAAIDAPARPEQSFVCVVAALPEEKS